MTAYRMMFRVAGLAMLALGALTACTVAVDDPGPQPRPDPLPPQMCTMDYAPVCGQRGPRRQTFANACQARADGFAVIGRGECRRDEGRPDVGRPDRPQFCTREYDPVCGRRGPRRQTFSNACTAESEGFRVIGRGECRRAEEPVERPQVCTREYNPVCGRRGGRIETFPNACTAESEGFRVVGAGACR